MIDEDAGWAEIVAQLNVLFRKGITKTSSVSLANILLYVIHPLQPMHYLLVSLTQIVY